MVTLLDEDVLPSLNTPDLSCSATRITPGQNYINLVYYARIPFRIVILDPSGTLSNSLFVDEVDTDDQSFVDYLRTSPIDSSAFVDTVHIESSYFVDKTLAAPASLITLTYTLIEPVNMVGGVSNQLVTIFGRPVQFICEEPRVDINTLLNILVEKAYAQVTPGRVTCVATTTVTDTDINNNISGYVVPFSIENSFSFSREPISGGSNIYTTSLNISTTTDSSLVRVIKNTPAPDNPVTYVPGIIPVGLISDPSSALLTQENVTEVKTEMISTSTKEVLGLTPEIIGGSGSISAKELAKKRQKGVLGADGLIKTGFDSRNSILLGLSLFILAAISINHIHRKAEKKI